MKTGLKKYGVQITMAVVILVVFLGHALGHWTLAPLGPLERQIYDTRMALLAPRGVDPRIVIVDIDEESLSRVGRWPWNRKVMGQLVDQLFDRYHVAVLGFDMVFAEQDQSSGLSQLEALASGPLKEDAGFAAELTRLRPSLDFDGQFARSLKNRATVLGYYFNFIGEKDHNAGALPPPALAQSAFADREPVAYSAANFGGNLSAFTNATPWGGHFNPGNDADGVLRHVQMLVEYQGLYYEPLSLAVARAYWAKQNGAPVPIRPVYPEGFMGQQFANVIGLQVGRQVIPVSSTMEALIAYRGPQGSFPYVSAADVLDGKVDAAILKDRIVLLGTTAPGLKDLRVTPVDGRYAGVEMHANLIASLLDGHFPEQPDYMPGLIALLMLASTGLLLFVVLRFSPVVALSGTLAWLVLVTLFNGYIWKTALLDMPLGALLSMVAGQYVVLAVYGYFFETRRKKVLSRLFGRYAPPELVQKMSDDPESYTMEGQSRELTMLFSDVRDFTSLSEAMDPKELAWMINEFLTALSRVIREGHLGTIDKYIGDCVMAFWGAPFPDEQHARHAVLAGLAMQQAMRDLAPVFRERGWPEIQIGVGVNTGRVTVGDMGSQYRKAYTVMGDAVNLASRLEGLTRHLGVGMIVGPTTREQAGDILFRELGRVRVKGREEAVAIYEPLGLPGAVPEAKQKQVEQFHQALRYCRARDWDRAELQLLTLLQQGEDPVSQFYLARIVEWRNSDLPDTWDGVLDFLSK